MKKLQQLHEFHGSLSLVFIIGNQVSIFQLIYIMGNHLGELLLWCQDDYYFMIGEQLQDMRSLKITINMEDLQKMMLQDKQSLQKDIMGWDIIKDDSIVHMY